MWMNILDSRYRRRLFRLLLGVPLACAATQVAAATGTRATSPAAAMRTEAPAVTGR